MEWTAGMIETQAARRSSTSVRARRVASSGLATEVRATRAGGVASGMGWLLGQFTSVRGAFKGLKRARIGQKTLFWPQKQRFWGSLFTVELTMEILNLSYKYMILSCLFSTSRQRGIWKSGLFEGRGWVGVFGN